jgi:hypothetical protein
MPPVLYRRNKVSLNHSQQTDIVTYQDDTRIRVRLSELISLSQGMQNCVSRTIGHKQKRSSMTQNLYIPLGSFKLLRSAKSSDLSNSSGFLSGGSATGLPSASFPGRGVPVLDPVALVGLLVEN